MAAGRVGRYSDALFIFDAISKLGFHVDLKCYNSIIWAAGNSGDTESARKLYEELLMHHPNLLPNEFTYGSLMHGCAKTKDATRAMYYLKEMEKRQLKPNEIILTSAMDACSGKNSYKMALSMLDRMKEVKLKPDITMMNAAIKVCCLDGEVELAERYARYV
jgi:pentatricopeptide repeat protein